MTARSDVTPLEARCKVCGDTGEKNGDGQLDCTACDVADKRLALNAYMQSVCNLVGSDRDWAVYQYAQKQVSAVEATKEYACFIDLEEGQKPDSCVLDGGVIDHCFYARKHGIEARKHCGEWKPVKFAAVSAAPSGEEIPEPKEGEFGWRPACCDGGEEGSACCDGGCAANKELAELRRAAITATKE